MRRERGRQPEDHEAEEDADREHLAEALKVPAMPAPAPRWFAGRLFMTRSGWARRTGPSRPELREEEAAKPQ